MEVGWAGTEVEDGGATGGRVLSTSREKKRGNPDYGRNACQTWLTIKLRGKRGKSDDGRNPCQTWLTKIKGDRDVCIQSPDQVTGELVVGLICVEIP